MEGLMRRLLILLYTALLCAFTVWLALDTFVLTRKYAEVELPPRETTAVSGTTEVHAPIETEAPETAVSGDPLRSEDSYRDGNISITLKEYRIKETTVYVADVTLFSPDYLRTVLARGTYGRNVTETSSAMAERTGAILAINGDYYGSRERGYVIRNGELLRASSSGGEDLVIYADGSFAIIDEDEVSAESLLADGAIQVFCFGPALVANGEIAVDAGEEVGRAMVNNPRTAIAILETGHYLFVVADGRTTESKGLSLRELADFLCTLGAETAYNLDGGGSSTMVFGGRVVNRPTTNGRQIKERSVSDIVCIIP